MRDNQRDELNKRLFAVASFYEKSVTPMILDVWWMALQFQDFEAVCGALSRHLQDPDRGMWMPKPADIMAAIHGKGSESAELAWGKIHKAIGRAGRNNDVVFDDGFIHAAIEDFGGWVKLCCVTDDELPFVRNQIVKSYKAYRDRGEMPEYPRVLTGLSNLHNAANGFRCARPLLIGDAEKAQAVLANGASGASLRITTATDAVLKLVSNPASSQKIA